MDNPHKMLPLHVVEPASAYAYLVEEKRKKGELEIGRERERGVLPRSFKVSHLNPRAAEKTQNPLKFVNSEFCQLPFFSHFNILRAT